MEEILQEILPDISSNHNCNSRQIYITCANCCSSFDSSRSASNEITDSSSQHHSFSDSFTINEVAKSCEIDDLCSTDVNKMLSEIYNLNFIPRLKRKYYPTSGEELINTEQVDFPLCSPCTSLLNNLFSLYSQFNQIRKIESLLSQQINDLNSLIDFRENQNQKSNQNNKSSGASKGKSAGIINSSKFKFPSTDRGPWIKVGPRLEDLAVEAVGYAPPSLRHLYQEATPNNLIIGDVFSPRQFSISSNDDDNDNDMDYQPSPMSDPLCYEEEDVKPFAHPVDMETDFGLDSESPKKPRKSLKKAPTPKKTTKVKPPKLTTKKETKKPVAQKPKQKKKSVLVKEELIKENSDAVDDEDEYLPPSVKKQAPGKKRKKRAPSIGPKAKKRTAQFFSELRVKSLPKKKEKSKKSKVTGKKVKKEATATNSSTSETTRTAATTTTTNIDSNVDDFPVNLPLIVGEPPVLTYDQVATKKEEGWIPYRERRQMAFKHQYRRRQEKVPCPCLYCPEDFQTPEERITHVRKSHCKNRKFACEICGTTFATRNIFTRHQTNTVKKCSAFLDKAVVSDALARLTCSVCQKVFKAADYVKSHMDRMHPQKSGSEAEEKKTPLEKKYPCTVVIPEKGVVCPYRAQNPVLLKNHIRNVHAQEHEKVKCSECGVVVKNAQYLKFHFQRKHTERGRQSNERSQAKTKAKKRANTKADNAKGFICPHCGVDFITKPRYTIHLAKAHDDYGTRYQIVVCELCGKKFQGKYRHMKHMKSVHIDTRHFVCDECGLSYKSQSTLDTHKFRCHSESGRQHYNDYKREDYRRTKMINEQRKRKAVMGAEMSLSDSGSVEVPDASIRSSLPPPASIPTAVMGPQGNSLQQTVPPPPPVDFEGSVPANLSLNLFSHNMAFGF